MNTVIWIVQILLALAFAMTGLMKLTQPIPKLAERMKYVSDFPPTIIRVIGLLEMLGAAATHVRRHEYANIVTNIVLLALAAFVIYGRFVAVPLG